MWKKIGIITGAIIGVLTLVGMVWKYDANLAKAGEVAQEVLKLQQTDEKQPVEIQSIKDDIKLDNIQKRIWNLDAHYGIGCAECPPSVMQEYRELEWDKKRLSQ